MGVKQAVIIGKSIALLPSSPGNDSFSNIIDIPVFCTPVSTAMAVTSLGSLRKRIEVKQPNINPHQGSKRPAIRGGHVMSLRRKKFDSTPNMITKASTNIRNGCITFLAQDAQFGLYLEIIMPQSNGIIIHKREKRILVYGTRTVASEFLINL